MPFYYVSYYNGWPLFGILAVDAFLGHPFSFREVDMPTGVLAADNWMPVYYVCYYNGRPLFGQLAVDSILGGGDGGGGLFCLLSLCQLTSEKVKNHRNHNACQ